MFVNPEEKKICDEYLENGYVIRKVADEDSLHLIKEKLIKIIYKVTHENNIDEDQLLNNFHKIIDIHKLNDLRLMIINQIQIDEDFRKYYFLIAKPYLEYLVGNELAMQLRLNLSIQIPLDKSSLLPVHADTWSGDSPFETVVWLPLVDCYKTKSMFILDPKNNQNLIKNFSVLSGKSSEDLFNNIKDKVQWIKIKFGEVLIFNQILPHGNRTNEEKETRWSLNCRFKGIFTPYKDKKIGEFFEPITLKASSIAGMKYKDPE